MRFARTRTTWSGASDTARIAARERCGVSAALSVIPNQSLLVEPTRLEPKTPDLVHPEGATVSDLETNKRVVIDYYQTAFQGNPAKAVATT
jgi:hypothetical protein